MSDEWCMVDGDGKADDDDDDAVRRRGRCRPGDHVSAPRMGGCYRHHGILLDGDEVWHVNGGVYAGPLVCCGLRPAMVRVDPVRRFLKGAEQLTLERRGAVDDFDKLRAGTGATTRYDLLFFNCEHHATGAGGAPVSWQSRRAALVVALAVFAGSIWGAAVGSLALVSLGSRVADGAPACGCEAPAVPTAR